MTTVIYNGVEIRNCLLKRFEQECVLDDSGTDKLYDKFTIRVEGWIHRITETTTPTVGIRLAANPIAANSIGGLGVAPNHIIARRLLMEVRGEFRMIVGDFDILRCGPRLTATSGDETTRDVTYNDVNNGPKPKFLNVTRIVGTELLPVEFELEICKVDCSNPTNQIGVLNNRWSMRDVIDQNWYTTRTITGRLRVADPNLNPQSFRGLVFPPLQAGFKRENIETTTSPDGLNLDYSVTDREVFAACPDPGTTWEGTHTLTSGDGSMTHGEITISMEGPKDADKRTMIAACALICRQKLDLLDASNTLEQASIIDHMHTNKVEMRCLVLQNSAKDDDRVRLLNLPAGNFAKVIELDDYNKDRSRVPKPYGTATVTGLFVSYLQTPCGSRHGVPQTTAHAAESEPQDERSDNPKTYTYEGELPADKETGKNYSEEARAGIYTFYQIDTLHTKDMNTVQLPVSTDSRNLPDTSVFVSLARPTMKRTVVVTAQRYGKWPQLPAPLDDTLYGNIRVKLLGKIEYAQKVPQFTADGRTQRFESSLTFTVGYSRPLKDGEAFPIGKIPWDTTSFLDNRMPQEVLSTDQKF